MGAGLFADAETTKNLPQQIVAAELARDLVEGELDFAEFLGHQFTGAQILQAVSGGDQALLCLLQGRKVPPG